MKKIITFLMIVVFIAIIMRLTVVAKEETKILKDNTVVLATEEEQKALQIGNSIKEYSHYLEEKAGASMGEENITVSFEELKSFEGDFDKKDRAVSIEENGFIDVIVNVPEAGLYELELMYMTTLGRSAPAQIMVRVNQEILYRQAETIILERIWQDETNVIETDANGNDVRPDQVEKSVWSKKRLADSTGYHVQPLLFYLEQGENTITIIDNREAFLLSELTVCAPKKIVTYESYIANYAEKELATQSIPRIQAEQTAWKTDPTLLPGFDRTSSLTEPYKGSKISLNTIGGNAWSMSGQEISWSFEVPVDALYEVRFKVKQNFIRGTYSGRTLRIDGEIPFKEAENIKFIYDSKWQLVTLGEKERPYYIYLTKGKHELSMQVTLGDLGTTLNKVETSTQDINDIYRKFFMIMGYTPDTLRDYKLERQLPEVFTLMADVADRLDAIVEDMSSITGTKGTELLSLTKMAMCLRDFVDKPYEIPAKFNIFTGNISALNAWKNEASIRPLEIDYIDIVAPGAPFPQVNPSFVQSIVHSFNMFAASFTENYDSLGSTSENTRTITVWSTMGRDQAQVLNQLIKSNFSKETGINVEIQLVKPEAILPSTVAGNGPDVILNANQQLPINFAIRSAAVDLSKFEGYEEATQDFRESALLPVEFNGGVYGLPELETFPVIFYRKDVLEEINVQIPNTWEDVLKIIPQLQKNNMSFLMETGVASGVDTNIALDIYAMLLYQRDGKIYEGDGIRTLLDEELAIETFKDWCKLYTNYGLPTNFNTAYRFRTGESPIVIADMSLYNTLMVSAPEIKGLWGIATVPGTMDSNGNANKSVKTKTSYTIMTTTSKDQEAAWEFMKWWVSADIQEAYSRDLESLMGTSARNMTANTVAFGRLPWSTKDLDAIMEQGEWTIGVPEVAGGYFLSRHINNAFRSVVVNKAEPREALITYAGIINEELNEKRLEFGLPVFK